MWLNVGSSDETAATSGISHFIEHMVFKGTKKRSLRQIAESLESVGGYLNAFTSKEQTCYYARALDNHLELAIDVTSDLTLNPLFDAKELEREKHVVIEELHASEDDPDDIIHDHFERELCGARHPFGRTVLGTEKSLLAFNRSTLNEYRHAQYTPGNMVLAVSGNVNHDTVCKLAEKYFLMKEVKGKKSAVQKNFSSSTKPLVLHRDIQQAHWCAGTHIPGSGWEQRYAMGVLNTALGDGMSSRLFQRVREQHGLAYTVYSFLNLYHDFGTFGVYLSTEEKKLERARKLVAEECEKLADKKISAKELSRSKEQIKGSIILGLESVSNRMMRIGKSELQYGKVIAIDEVLAKIDAVTAEDVLALAEKFCSTKKFVNVVIAPKKV